MVIIVAFSVVGFVVGYIVQSLQTSVIFCGTGFFVSLLVRTNLLSLLLPLRSMAPAPLTTRCHDTLL